MVFIVDAKNRHGFARDLQEMHRQRRQIFVKGLGWPLSLADDEFEVDEYDGTGVIYLLAQDELGGRLRASARLLRTDRAHPLLDLFPHLCDGEDSESGQY